MKMNIDKMRKYILLSLASAVMLLTSCLGKDSSDSDITYYSDTAITGFSLGTLNRYFHTTGKSGQDSIYKRTYSGSTYKFSIDQQNRKVFNLDSLPLNTDPKHIICAITTKNSGVPFIKSIDTDEEEWKYFSSADSIDFSSPRQFRISNMTGDAYRDYIIQVNIHKEDGDSLKWEEMTTNEELSQMSALKALFLNDNVYVFGNVDGKTVGYKSAMSDGENWKQLNSNINTVFGPKAYANTLVWNDKIYMLNDGMLIASADGENWSDVSATTLTRLVACSYDRLYAIDGGTTIVSSIDGKTWTGEVIDSDIDLFPTECIGFRNGYISAASFATELMVVGTRDEYLFPTDEYAHMWRQLDEYEFGDDHPWTYLASDETNMHRLPNLKGMAIVPYGEYLIAMGAKGQGASTVEAFKQIYVSRDGGITWKKDKRFPMPESIDVRALSVGMAVDENSYIWIVLGGTGQVFKGRLNSMVWDVEQKEFKY